MEIDKETLNKIVQVLENHHTAIDAILDKLDMKGKIPNPKIQLKGGKNGNEL